MLKNKINSKKRKDIKNTIKKLEKEIQGLEKAFEEDVENVEVALIANKQPDNVTFTLPEEPINISNNPVIEQEKKTLTAYPVSESTYTWDNFKKSASNQWDNFQNWRDPDKKSKKLEKTIKQKRGERKKQTVGALQQEIKDANYASKLKQANKREGPIPQYNKEYAGEKVKPNISQETTNVANPNNIPTTSSNVSSYSTDVPGSIRSAIRPRVSLGNKPQKSAFKQQTPQVSFNAQNLSQSEETNYYQDINPTNTSTEQSYNISSVEDYNMLHDINKKYPRINLSINFDMQSLLDKKENESNIQLDKKLYSNTASKNQNDYKNKLINNIIQFIISVDDSFSECYNNNISNIQKCIKLYKQNIQNKESTNNKDDLILYSINNILLINNENNKSDINEIYKSWHDNVQDMIKKDIDDFELYDLF